MVDPIVPPEESSHVSSGTLRAAKRPLSMLTLWLLRFILVRILWVNEVEGFVATSRSYFQKELPSSTCTLSAKKEAIGKVLLRFSPSFQRHVVHDINGTVIESFKFLDDALGQYPTATVTRQGYQTFESDKQDMGCFAGAGVHEQTAYREILKSSSPEYSGRGRLAFHALMALAKLATEGPRAQNATAVYLADKAGKLRFLDHSPDTIRAHYKALTKILKNWLDMDAIDIREKILSKFPQLCLYDLRDVVERLRFFLSPLPPSLNGRGLDWALLASQGYGAGMTKQQVRDALRAVPHILSMSYADSAVKPAFGYYLYILRAPFELVNTAKIELKDNLEGGTVSDMAFMTYLKSLGLSWDQLRIILDAFPTIVTCDTHPKWEMISKGVVSKRLAPRTLQYLQTRLQIRPREVQAMLITHTRVNSYSISGKIKPTLDALQSKLGLSSVELSKIILRMPSLIGASAKEGEGFQKRIHFLRTEVNMTMKDVKRAVIRQPSLLQYSVNATLRAKIDFLCNELCVPKSKVAKVIATTPGIMGLSLDENLRPSATSFMEYIEILDQDMGAIVVKMPQLLASSWKSNLEPKLRYLSNRLDLETPQLREIVKRAPRILQYNVENSIEPKLKMIEQVLLISRSMQSTKGAVLLNPALLVSTNDVLRKRLDLAMLSSEAEGDIEKSLGPRFPTIMPETQVPSNLKASSGGNEANILLREADNPVFSFERDGEPLRGLIGAIVSSSYKPERGYAPGVVPIVAYAAGRVYPQDSSKRVRGLPQVGGASLFFPQVAYGSQAFKKRFRQAAYASFSLLVSESEDGVSGDGIALAGFSGLRPSRPRTELGACHSALKCIFQLLGREAAGDPMVRDAHFQIDIYTGSDYAWRLLRNETLLVEWGRSASLASFKKTEAGSRVAYNPDILYSLCKTMKRMMSGAALTDQAGNPVGLGKKVNVRFLHASDGNSNHKSIRLLGALASGAAQWRYYTNDDRVPAVADYDLDDS